MSSLETTGFRIKNVEAVIKKFYVIFFHVVSLNLQLS